MAAMGHNVALDSAGDRVCGAGLDLAAAALDGDFIRLGGVFARKRNLYLDG